jgi:hypothetical protein
MPFFTKYFIDLIDELCKDSDSDFNNINYDNTFLEHSRDFNIDNLFSSNELFINDKSACNVFSNALVLNNCDLPLHGSNNTQGIISNNVNSERRQQASNYSGSVIPITP